MSEPEICAFAPRQPGVNFPLVWRWRKRLPERYGQRCRMLTRSRRMNSIAVEFPDGFRVVTSAWAVRKAK